MPIRDGLLPEFDEEMKNTRRMLERVPEDRLPWKPHPKSMDMRYLASHVAQLPDWAVFTIKQTELDYAPVGAEPYKMPLASSNKELLAMFDTHVSEARAAIGSASDETLMTSWTLLAGGRKVFTMPRIAVIRSMVMNHLIHHRAQLSVYLRLNDVPVPGMYGPSADEMTPTV